MAANHLINEKSPYLQQHAYNPVDWYPWGPEAFEKARRETKPIFLSVGYSTCHWCHVMEHESFENEQIAVLLNRHFVSIKVDREERPDIDRVYMAYVQAATGSGGWPMSVWVTPDGAPFVGGTYFPPVDRYGRPGFATVLERIASAWRSERDRIVESSENVLAQLHQQAVFQSAGGEPDAAVLDRAFAGWRRTFDTQHGGFGQAPKFPRPAVFDFLLRYWARTKNAHALEMVKVTLLAMARGGMNDQIGGGFHRYSVDEYWFVPHFEKMLYDQAQIVSSLIEVFQITGDPAFSTEARRVLDYVLRDMTSPDGAFFSAEDADSVMDVSDPRKKGEGAFYVWSASEIARAIGEADARLFFFRYGISSDGNVQNDPHNEFAGRNILFQANSIEESAHHFDLPEQEVTRRLNDAAAKLMAVRSRRIRPHLDDKILTSWNGLMIAAFAKAGAVLNEPRYAAAARRSADFLRERLWNPETRTLLRRYRDGEALIPGFLDDYAFFIRALLELYETQFDVNDLAFATTLADRQIELFADTENGAFFSTAKGGGGSQLVMRMKDDYDGAEPSGNSVAALNLLRLERLTGISRFGDIARETLRAFAGHLDKQSFGVPLMLCALDFSLYPPKQVVVAGERNDLVTQEMMRALASLFEPNRVVILASAESRSFLGDTNPAIAAMTPLEGHTAAYVCENFTCQLAVTEVSKLMELLQ